MDDDNVVAYIYPALGTPGYRGAVRCIEENTANPGYLPPTCRGPQVPEAQHGPPDIFARRGREATVDEEDQDEEEHDDLRYEACIKVTFDHIPKTTYGLRAGRNDVAELRLVKLPGVSFLHFALTFDANYRLVVRDLGSTCGTTVIYDRLERARRSHFDWIVGGSDFLEGVSRIIVKVAKSVQFQLVVPRHDIQSESYKAKVDRFRAGTADTEQLLDLGRVGLLSRVRTELPSGVQTPSPRAAKEVTVRKEIGHGTFAVVYRVWNVSTGEQYAHKIPKGNAFDAGAWERETRIMDRIDHKHIVALLNSSPPPSPWLHLEYLPEGSVGDHLKAGRPFSHFECKQILAQASDALTYLHTLEPQIVHRDVTTNNILILHRRPGDLFIKFADFGLSREGDAFRTICGTYLYLAPEVYEANAIPLDRRPTYTALVDVWSLGVVLVELLVGLPKHGGMKSMGVEWCRRVRQRVESVPGLERDELLELVREWMLCLRPEGRKSATECRKEALRLLDSNNEERNGGVSGGHCLGSFGSEASTIRLGEAQGSGELSAGSSSLSRYIISDAERGVGSCIAPSPEATSVHAGELLTRLVDPEDSLFYKSNFGEDSNDGRFSDAGDSGSASTTVIAYKPQDEQVEGSPRSVLEVATAVETDDLENRLCINPLQELLTDALRAIAEETGMAIGDDADATLSSVKRSRATSSSRAGACYRSINCATTTSPSPTATPYAANRQAMTTQLSVDHVLSLPLDKRHEFVKQNLSSEDTLNIDNITGWEDLPDGERDLLAPLLLAAVHETAPTAPTVGPVDATDLAALLARIPSDRERHTITTHYPSPSRSSTAEPLEAHDYETKCYHALLHDGCRPLFPISLLAQVETSPDAYRDLLRPWMRYPDTSDSEDWQVFSRQRDRWKQFRTWQLRIRRQTPSFSAYLEEYRRDCEMSGESPEQTDRPEFEQIARRLWEREYDYGPPQLHDSPEAVFSRYAGAARTLLADHGFIQPFQLQADSEQQDQWTTFVEYLAFECYFLEKLDVAARKLQKKPSRAPKYQTARAEVEHQQHRVHWVRSEISKIEAELNAAGKSNGSNLGRSGKRKLIDDGVGVDGAPPPVVKRRRTDETQKMVAGWSNNSRITRRKKRRLSGDDDAAEPKLKTAEKVAGRSDNTRTARSKKRKLLADEVPPEPKLKIEEVTDESNHPRARSRKSRKGIHEKNGSAAPGTVLQSLVSKVDTRSRPRRESKHERLKTLRPRANGEVVSVRGLKTRGGQEAQRLATLNP
ncbi:hypothetical protein P154DRAFT_530654 [Amniculicola lignicola CBS 123094]|uniref:EKC/KEOPS complex subunit BUD32 n=1 Tax=Amniculicola lignicola CBS 123094 TaxID=1392246 RepID=A0A6A5WWW4_9PLEO|nr:hypothetical protein P154DRAFT_530654 [Amniculicola lignicola CBS 123094]